MTTSTNIKLIVVGTCVLVHDDNVRLVWPKFWLATQQLLADQTDMVYGDGRNSASPSVATTEYFCTGN